MNNIIYDITNTVLFCKESFDKINSHLNKTINFNELIAYEDFGLSISDYTLLSAKDTLFFIEYEATLTLDIYYKKSLIEKKRTITFSLTNEAIGNTMSFDIKRRIIFTNTKNDYLSSVYNDDEISRKFDLFFIVLLDAIHEYMIDNPIPEYGYVSRLKEKLFSTELGLMVYNNFNQQVIQNSFRDIDTSEQNDIKYKTTAKGLEESLSNIVLPKGEGLTIQNVELNDAFRISYT